MAEKITYKGFVFEKLPERLRDYEAWGILLARKSYMTSFDHMHPQFGWSTSECRVNGKVVKHNNSFKTKEQSLDFIIALIIAQARA